MISKRIIKAVLVLSVLVFAASGAVSTVAAPARNSKAKPGDCVACHKSEKVLPVGHPATKDMKFDGCAQCHAPKTANALTAKLPASHLHQLKGVGCTQCHGKTKKPTDVAFEKCIACHDTTKLVETTGAVKPKNPHISPHYGKDADCNLCHRQHAKSENYCAQCHKFEFTVP